MNFFSLSLNILRGLVLALMLFEFCLAQASVELQGMKGLWSLQASSHDKFDSFLVVSFITETRILAINADDELEETKIDGFDAKAETLFCCTAIHEQLVQVHKFLYGSLLD
jgi:hypothetical protein